VWFAVHDGYHARAPAWFAGYRLDPCLSVLVVGSISSRPIT
jgi:hypothetical protein